MASTWKKIESRESQLPPRSTSACQRRSSMDQNSSFLPVRHRRAESSLNVPDLARPTRRLSINDRREDFIKRRMDKITEEAEKNKEKMEEQSKKVELALKRRQNHIAKIKEAAHHRSEEIESRRTKAKQMSDAPNVLDKLEKMASYKGKDVEELLNLAREVAKNDKKKIASPLKNRFAVEQMHDAKAVLSSALHLAAEAGNIHAVDLLLQANCDPNLRDDAGWSVSHIAARTQHRNTSEILQHVVNSNANLELKGNSGFRVIHIAAGGNIPALKFVLSHKVCVDPLSDDGMTPLHIAANLKSSEVTSLLIEARASLNTLDASGLSPLHSAVTSNCADVLDILATAKADINLKDSSGTTALHIATSLRDSDSVRNLISHKCDVNIPNSKNVTPLHIACSLGDFKIVSLLLNGKGNVNSIQSQDKLTPLHHSVLSGSINILKLLIKNKAYIDPPSIKGCTPLHLAAEFGSLESCKILMEGKANMNHLTSLTLENSNSDGTERGIHCFKTALDHSNDKKRKVISEFFLNIINSDTKKLLIKSWSRGTVRIKEILMEYVRDVLPEELH